MRMIFPARLEPDPDGGFNVTFRDAPEAITAGDDEAEALANAAEALTAALLGRIKDKVDIPAPTRSADGERPVALDAAPAAKIALYMAWREAGLTKVALADRLGTDEAEIRRMLDPHHNTRLDRLETSLRSLGRRLVVTVEAA
jgi:antitoxin HicB